MSTQPHPAEARLHQDLIDLLQAYANTHGLVVTTVSANWQDRSTHERAAFQCDTLTLQTTVKRPHHDQHDAH